MKKLKYIATMSAVSLLMITILFIIIPKMTNHYYAAVEYTGDQYVTKSGITNTEGEEISDGGTLDVSTKYELSYEWELPDNTFNKGDKLIFSIPPEFTIVETFNFPLSVDGEEVAQAKIMGNDADGYHIEMTFTTDYVETHSEVSGTFDMMFRLNKTYIKKGGDITITFPDSEITVEVPNFDVGGGGAAIGSGVVDANRKKGSQKDVNMINPVTGEQNEPTTVLEWIIELGKDTLLGEKAKTLDDIDKVIITDAPKDQRLIPVSAFDYYLPNAFGIEKAFYSTIGFNYDGITESDMNVEKDALGEYYESFSIDALPHIKQYDEVAEQAGSELDEWNLVYYTVPLFETEENTEFDNNATVTVYYKDSALDPDEWTLSATQMWNVASGSIGGKVAGAMLTKTDADNNQALPGAEFDLYKIGSSGNKLIKENLVSDNDGHVSVENLTTGEYYFIETKSPTGYEEPNDEKIGFKVTTADLVQANQEVQYKDLGDIPNKKVEDQKTSVTVTKKWEDNNDQDGKRPNRIQVQLYADGEAEGRPVTLSENNNWTTTWSDLNEKANGNVIEYTVEEIGNLPGYETDTNNQDQNDIIITNTHQPETTEVNGIKTWDDKNNQDDMRPTEVTVNLLADGEEVDSKEVTEKEDWEYEFTNLPKYKDGERINYTVTEDTVPDYSTEINGTTIINSYTPGKTSVTVTKRWEDNNNQDGKRPNTIRVQLLADGNKKGKPVHLNEGNDWTTTWNDLDVKSSGDTISYSVEEVDSGNEYDSEIDDDNQGNIIITNSYTPEEIELGGTKIWEDNDDQDGRRPSSVILNLLANGDQIDSQEVLAENDWEYEFTNLPKYEDGEEITYTVTEDSVPDYSTEIIGNTIINSYTPGETSVTVTKNWEDNNDQDGKRPNDIEVQLYANEEAYGDPVVLNEGNDWTTTWTELDMNVEGEPIHYTVEEVDSGNEYDSEIDDDNQGNIMITNSYIPEETEISGTKIWKDNEDQDGARPDTITVNLLADGELVDTKEVTEATNWTYEFTNLPKNNNGEEINYTVTENVVPDYSTEISGTTITNSYTPGKTSVRVTKRWEDRDNQDGIRPNDIKVQLYADGKAKGNSILLNDGNDWTTSWDELDEKKAGKTIDYTVQEIDEIEGYQSTIKDSDKGNIILTNTYTPETTEIKGTKTWEDKNDQDGERPTTISVNLLANGKVVATKEATKANNWRYEFTDLPKKQEGENISYTVTEDTIPGYSTEIAGTDITNHYAPNETSVTVTKRWEDSNNQDGKRPNDIEVQLYANGKAHGNPVTLNEGNDWTTTWIALDEKANGTKINYTVAETKKTEGYQLTINNANQGNIILTNSYTPEEIEIKGTKSWEDKDNQDGKRPASITVNLLANGKVVDTKVVTEKENWNYKFAGLAKNEEGKEIQYTVTENTIPDYSTKVTGMDITNGYTPGKTSVSVTKRWEDRNNQDGIRPNDIKVQLYANGKKQGDEVVLNDGNKWTTTWDELDEKKAGQTIAYTVEEVDVVNGYETTIQAVNQGNILITNSYTPEETKVEGTKTWKDKNNQDGERPTAITVNLLANGKVVEAQEATEKENWAYRFRNLPKYEAGTEILYTITENAVPGYTTEMNGANLTNSHTPGETSVTVTKRWEDGHNQDGIRPDDLKVQLYADGEKVDNPVNLNEKNNWMTTWTGLDEKKSGEFIVYTVKEVDNVVGYKTTIDGADHGNIVITNSYTPEETELKGTKTWDDNDNQDGKRPKTVSVNLLGNGAVIATKEVTEANGWNYEFTNLPKKEAGEDILYTVTENTVPDYTTEINGTDITNHYTPGKTSLTVTKHWEDNHNQDSIRSKEIKAQLYADGKAQGNPVTLNNSNNWTTTWPELDEKTNGKTIEYHVEEVSKIKGYTTTTNTLNQGNILLTNSHTPKAPTPGGKSNNGISGQSSSNKGFLKEILPTTGESIQLWFVLVGMLLVGIAVFLFWSKYKK